MNVNGMTGTIELSEDSVNRPAQGQDPVADSESLAIEKRIPFGQVVGVHIRPAGPLKRGCIEFIVDGWARGDHAILFNHHQQPAFEALSRAVTQKVAEISCSPAAEKANRSST